jgi:hypothetical protein
MWLRREIAPWRYIKDVLDSREFFFEQSIAITKEELAATPATAPIAENNRMI